MMIENEKEIVVAEEKPVKLCEHMVKLLTTIAETKIMLVGVESLICPCCPDVVLVSRNGNSLSLTKVNLKYAS